MRKIDAIYENIAELNKLTGNSSFVEALSQKVSDGGYMNPRLERALQNYLPLMTFLDIIKLGPGQANTRTNNV